MADLASLIALLAQQRPFPGGPQLQVLPKAQSNATAANVPAVRTPPLSSPTDMLNALSTMSNVQGENKLRDLQAQQAATTIGLMGAAMQPAPPMFDNTSTASSGRQASSQTANGNAGAAPAVADYTADATMEPEQRALLDSIAGPESGGRYNIRYTPDGGTTFADYSDHPRIAERGPQGPSTAAGRYEIVATTWDPAAKKLGLTDFSPVSQDRGAWHLAEAAYHTNTGRDLLADLKNGDTSRVASALSGEWPTIGRAIRFYGANLAKYTSGGGAAGSASAAPSIPELPDTSLSGAGDAFRPSFGGGAPAVTGNGYATALAPVPAPSGSFFGSLAPGSPTLNNGQPAFPPGQPRNSRGEPISPSLATMTPQDKANVAASMAAIQGNPAWANLPPGMAPIKPIGFGSLAPAPIRTAQNGPLTSLPSAPQPQSIAPAFGSLAPAPPSAGPQISPAYLQWAQAQDRINSLLGRRNPVALEKALELQFAGPMAAATMSAQKPIELQYAAPLASAQAWAKVVPDLFTKWNSPVNARPGGGVLNPSTGDLVGAVPTLQKVVDPATGQERFQYVAPPTSANPTGTGLGVAALGPGEREALVTRAKAEQEQRQTVINEANAAQQSRATLMNMANEAGSFKQGPFASHYQTAARYLRLIDPSWDGQVASYEDFVKNAGQLTRQAVRETSSRAAVQEFQMIGSSLPNPEMSDIGLRRVQNELIGLSDYRIAKSQAQQAWEQQHGGIGNVSGFETAFQRQASPYAFVAARMDPADLMEMRNKLQNSAEGRQELARLTQQLTYLKQAGLVQ